MQRFENANTFSGTRGQVEITVERGGSWPIEQTLTPEEKVEVVYLTAIIMHASCGDTEQSK